MRMRASLRADSPSTDGSAKTELGGNVIEVATGAARSRNDGVWIAVKPLLLAKVGDLRVDPDEGVLVAGDGLKLVGQ